MSSSTAPPDATRDDVPGALTRGRRWLIVGLVTALVIAVDQLTKWWALNNLDEPVELFWTLRLNLSFNTGIAFSLAPGLGPIIAVAAVVVVIILVRSGRSFSTPWGATSLGLVIGGATGNLLDRVFRGDQPLDGAVVDFIDLQWWPIFNVADAAIVVGAAMLALRALRGGHGASA